MVLKNGLEAGIQNVSYTVSNVTVTGNNETSVTIDPTLAFSFTKSSYNKDLIVSENLQSLELTNGSQFTISYYNQSNYTNKSSFSYTTNETWSHLNSSVNTLSCSLVYSPVNSNLGLILFDGKSITFKGPLPIPSTSYISANYLSNPTPGMFQIGENCDLIKI